VMSETNVVTCGRARIGFKSTPRIRDPLGMYRSAT
jgi:hypothetical protein